MSIRAIVCGLLVLCFCAYAWRNWFGALSAGIVLMAFLEHPDMPKSILGIQGLNLWNLLFLNVTMAWLKNRRREGLEWDMSAGVKFAFILYIGITIVGFLRLFVNPTGYYTEGSMKIVVDYLINPMKFLLPCFLLYDGCRSPERVSMALGAIMLSFLLLSIQVIKYMGLHFDLSGDALSGRAARILVRSVGYHRVDLSMMLSGASWAMVAYSRMFTRRSVRWGMLGAAAVVVLAQALTGGRTGYVTWGLIGLTLCLLRWRRLLPVIPAGVVAVIILVPGVAERMLQGFGMTNGPIAQETDIGSVTSGRTEIWPVVIGKIRENPVIGYGRLAMMRTGLAQYAVEELNDGFAHPHSAYLETLLDNGFLGSICVMPIYLVALARSLSLFRDRAGRVNEVAGATASALLLGLLIAGLGAQTFYPREGVFWMWACVGIALRLSVDRDWGRRMVALGSEPYLPSQRVPCGIRFV
ncbi:MAG: O-antigen ligase family protein [Verrucomicrobia bacterium]|nr:O-antigen ligase family protein [Verrucomicrobiota bacterium]